MLLTTRERIIVLCAGTLLGSAIAGFFLFGPPYVYTAQAAVLYDTGAGSVTTSTECTGMTGCDGGTRGRQQNFAGTGYPTYGALYVTCDGAGTFSAGARMYFRDEDFSPIYGRSKTWDGTNIDVNPSVVGGLNTIYFKLYDSTGTNPQAWDLASDSTAEIDFSSVASGTNCYLNYTTPSSIPGNFHDFTAGSQSTKEVAFALYDSDPTIPPDPRPGAVTVYDPPDETELDYYQLAAGAYTFRATSDVSADTYPEYDGTDYWDFRIKNESEEVVWVALLRSTGRLYYDTEEYYAYAIAPSLTLPVGAYTVEARVEWFEDGEAVEISDWATASDFTVSLGGELGGGGGGGGGASWGDEYGGGATDWDTFFASVDDHDTVYGACKLIGWSFTWDTGGSSESSAGDGLPCLWTWIQYALIPPADGFFNYLEYPLNVLLTRWPLAYVTTALQSLQDGLATSTACPLPTVGGSSIMGGATIPTVDPCEWFEDVATTVESSTAFVTLAVLGIYASLGLYAASRAREFLSS